jgi:hypothetical protein
MRRAGCGLAILGVLLCAGSLVAFGSSVFRALAAHEAHAAPLAPGASWTSGPLTVDTAKLSQVAVRGLVRSTHARRGSGENDDWDLEYAFPFRYTVFDAEGRILAQEAKDFASDGSAHSVTAERVTESGGSARLEQGFAKFPVPPPGTIRVEATLGEDVDYGATIESPEVVVYDNVSKHAKRIGIGIGLLIVGGGLAMLGVILVIVAAARGGQS